MAAFDGPSLPQRQPTAVAAFRGNAAAPPAQGRGKVLTLLGPGPPNWVCRIGSKEQDSPKRRSTRATADSAGRKRNSRPLQQPRCVIAFKRDAAALDATLFSAGLRCLSPARRGITH
jgi:hypothetical protein